MKTFFHVLVGFVLITYCSSAEGAPKAGELGIQTAVGITGTDYSPFSDFGAKYWITDAIALRASVGFAIHSGSGTFQPGTGYDLAASFEYHFPGKGGVSPYVGAQGGYSGGMSSLGGVPEYDIGARAVLGAEYFFSSSFSWAGEVAVGYESGYFSSGTFTTFGTDGAQMILTWYIN